MSDYSKGPDVGMSLIIPCVYIIGPNQTSKFPCTEIDTYLIRPKWYKFDGGFRRQT